MHVYIGNNKSSYFGLEFIALLHVLCKTWLYHLPDYSFLLSNMMMMEKIFNLQGKTTS